MKKIKITTALTVMAFGLLSISCNDGKTEKKAPTMPTETDAYETDATSQSHSPDSKQVVANYMALKDALVATDETAAAAAGKKLEKSVSQFNIRDYVSDDQDDLKRIMASASEHAAQIGDAGMAQQREYFEMLTKDVMDMVAITGTDRTLYQQFCPMYADNGGVWLSTEKEIRNPYFGDKMLKCGEVQKEIK